MARWEKGVRCVVALIAAIALAGEISAQDAPESDEIRFAFKDAPFEQVIEFFSGVTGLPVVWETDAPEGTLDYLAPESYTLDEALQVLNIILQAKGVMLRVSDDMLYLQRLEEMQRENIPTYVGELPADVTDDMIITVVRPLNIALAATLAEKLKALVATYGSITAMEQQNALVITETAAQVRRLLKIIEQLDREDPEGAIEIFSIENAQATDLMEPLKALLAQRVEKYVINEKGQQVKIEEESLPGLSIAADERTNTIVAKGVQSRIDKLRSAIELLDVPAVNQTRSIRTFALSSRAPDEAAARLETLYARLPEEKRPTVIALADVGRITIVGDERALMEGEALLREIDGGGAVDAPDGREISVIVLEHAEPADVSAALERLLNGRQLVATNVVIGPDGRSLIVAGAAADIAAIRAVVPALDRPARVDRQARLLQLDVADPAAVFERARTLHARQIDEDDSDERVDAELDAEAGTVTIVGSAAALDRFAEALRMAEDSVVVTLETRQIALAHARPSDVAETLAALAPTLLRGTTGRTYPDPVIRAVDALDAVLVTATPTQIEALEALARGLDEPGEEVPPLRILQLRTADAANLAAALTAQYNQRPAEDREERPVRITADPATNTLLVAAHPDMLVEIEAIAADLNVAGRYDEEGREIRIFPLTVARAEELARTIDAMFPAPPVPLDYRGRPMPHLQEAREVVVRADPQTNALIVDAPIQRMTHFETLVEQLDRQRIVENTEVRTFNVVHADLAAVATTLRELSAAGALRDGGAEAGVPITISTEDKPTPDRTRLVIARHFAALLDVDRVSTRSVYWRQLLSYEEVRETSGPTGEGRPRFFGVEATGDRIAFLIDLSDSMLEPLSDKERADAEALRRGTEAKDGAIDWKKIKTRFDLARLFLSRYLKALPSGKRFTVIGFGDHARYIKSTKGLVKATRGSVGNTIRELNRIKPTAQTKLHPHGRLWGGTNIHGAFLAAFALTTGKRLKDPAFIQAKGLDAGCDTIFLLSDGKPTKDNYETQDEFKGGRLTVNRETGETKESSAGSAMFNGPYIRTEFLLADVRRMNLFRKAEIHTVAMGDADGKLMRGLAEDGLGEYESVGVRAKGGRIRRWMVAAPFPLAADPGIEKSKFRRPAVYRSGEDWIGWKPKRGGWKHGGLDVGGKKDSCGYAYAEFIPDQAGEAELRLGAREMVRVWLNGALVLDQSEPKKKFERDLYKVKVTLKDGTNTLLLRVGYRKGRGKFHARLVDAAGKPLSIREP